ncbi:MAG: M28 family peptidase, partial [Myxococcota bacterium]
VQTLAASPRASARRRHQVREWLTEQLTAAGFTVTPEPFTLAGVSGTNLVATGLAPGRVVVGAHYDTVEDSPGADDNASGVAVTLAVARALGPDAPVTWVFFDAEEPSEAHGGATVGTDGRNFAFGSQAWADRHAAEVELGFVLESVGYTCREPGCQQVPGGVPASFPRDGAGVYWAVNRSERDWGALLATYLASSPGHPAHAITVPGRGAAIPQSRFSDHAPLWDAGVDAVLITDTALLRNPNYHHPTDHTVDAELLADVARGVAAAVRAATGRCGPG